MRFGPEPIGDAGGAILAHSLKAGGRAIKKGTRLDAGHLSRLAAEGVTEVVVARLEAGDVDEDAAAETLARALAGAGVRVGAPFTGRCNLFARGPGIALIEPSIVNAVNRVHESMTVATVAPYQPVGARQMLATVKIIPFAVERGRLDAALSAAAGAGVRVAPQAMRRPVLVQTRLPGLKESVLDKTRRITEERLQALGLRLARELRCEHAVEPLRHALGTALDEGADLVLVVGASAIVDRRDVIPAAIVACGGAVEHFGMPVDPGNLMLFARRRESVVLGLPGCARSASYNGLDQVLARVSAGERVSSLEVTALGVGGLLKEIAARPQPRRSPARPAASAPRVAALVLAAGRSRRMGRNKLLEPVGGKPMLAHVLDAVARSQVEWTLVVTGHEAERVVALLEGRDVQHVHNPDFARGLSTSLAHGLDGLPQEADAVLVCLGDMPRITGHDIDRLIAAFDPGEGRGICVPTFNGKRGNPVLWDCRYAAEMRSVRGDVGARHLIGEHDDDVAEVAMSDDAVLTDVDSPDALARLRGG